MNDIEMREVIESGFKVTLSKENSFRFCESPAYQRLSGLSLKEMDIGWWDTTNSKLILLELKSFKGKVTDTLLMLAAVWVKTEIGKEIKTSMPTHIHQYQGDGSVKLIFLIDTPASRKSLLLPVKDAINKDNIFKSANHKLHPGALKYYKEIGLKIPAKVM